MRIRLLLLQAELTNLPLNQPPFEEEQYEERTALPHQRTEIQTGAHGLPVTLLPGRQSQLDLTGLFLNK